MSSVVDSTNNELVSFSKELTEKLPSIDSNHYKDIYDIFCNIYSINCKGICKTDERKGQRCQIKYGLDDYGYCSHHRNQKPDDCLSKNNLLIKTLNDTYCVNNDLSDLIKSFNSIINSNYVHCLGICTSKGKIGNPCKINFDLIHGYCKYHQNQRK